MTSNESVMFLMVVMAAGLIHWGRLSSWLSDNRSRYLGGLLLNDHWWDWVRDDWSRDWCRFLDRDSRSSVLNDDGVRDWDWDWVLDGGNIVLLWCLLLHCLDM